MEPKLREQLPRCGQEGGGRYARPWPRGREGGAGGAEGQGRDRRRMRQGGVPQARAAADRSFREGASGRQAGRGHDPRHPGLRQSRCQAPRHRRAARTGSPASLLALSDAIAAILLAADLVVVVGSVLLRFVFNAPVEWADDVARGLMVGIELLRRGRGAGAQRESRRRVLRRPLPASVRPRHRRRRRAAGAGRSRPMSAFNAIEARLAHHRADHRLRPAAGADLLSDGRRRGLHDDLRRSTIFARARWRDVDRAARRRRR